MNMNRMTHVVPVVLHTCIFKTVLVLKFQWESNGQN